MQTTQENAKKNNLPENKRFVGNCSHFHHHLHQIKQKDKENKKNENKTKQKLQYKRYMFIFQDYHKVNIQTNYMLLRFPQTKTLFGVIKNVFFLLVDVVPISLQRNKKKSENIILD